MSDSRLRENYRGVFDTRIGFGTRPALLLVDFMRAYTTPGARLYAEAVVQAVKESGALLARARAAGIPIVHTRVQYSTHGDEGGLFVRKVPLLRSLVAGAPEAEFDPFVAPAEGETVLVKQYASAFFATPLASLLTARGVDTLVLAGCSTSGCVRATAVDGVQHGFRVIVPRECVGDRAPEPHQANLFDIDSKYGDVMPLAGVLRALAECAQG